MNQNGDNQDATAVDNGPAGNQDDNQSSDQGGDSNAPADD